MANILNNFWSLLGFNNRFSEKQFFNSAYQRIGLKGPILVDTTVPYVLFNEISELNQVVTRKAAMFSNGKFKLTDRETKEEIDDPELFDLLNRPNLLQSQNQWLKNYSEQLDVYGNQFMYKLRTLQNRELQKYPKALINVSARYVQPQLTGKFFDQSEMEGIVKSYKFSDDIRTRTFETNEVMWTKHDDLDNPIVGKSPLVSLKFPLSNTKLAYQYLNVISGEKGAIGMISSKTKDSGGTLPLKKEDRTRLEKQFSDTYGVQDHKSRVAIVGGDVSWQPMSYPTKDLLLMEQIDANKLTIVDHFGLNINIFSSKNQTFENVKNALIQSYNDSIIPAADAFTQSLSDALGIPPEQKLSLDYGHVSILQADRGTEAEILKKQLDSVKEAVNLGLITPEQARDIYRTSFGLDIQ